ncbi:MAG: GerMN domain-containing protein [Treponema sp.]|nr:GerMN domain-containing protein [Treponema sp.]
MLAGKKRNGSGGWLLFWLAFVIGVSLLFLVNLEKIKGTLQEAGILDRLAKGTEEEILPDLEIEIQSFFSPDSPGEAEYTAGIDGAGQKETEQTAQNREKPGVQDQTVERSFYLIKVDNTGALLWTRVRRNLPASDSPLFDALDALIRGPSVEEEKQGLISLIPKNVKILNTVVRGNTAYISFSEDFLFNTYGIEGYAGQRRQIVLTATEFDSVKDVQILIDGKRVDYLGEGIWIGSPVSRNML